jgi:pilus assembly protein CpaE
MTNTSTMVWAADDAAANREILEATAGELGLTVRFCAPRDLADTAENGRDRLVGIEAGADPARALALLAQVHERLPRATLLLAARDGSLGFIRSALEAGASDVLALPLHAKELHKALIRGIQAGSRKSAGSESHGEVITVCGARGGLGVTTVAVNLASRLAALTAAETALVDLDLQRGDVSAFLNLTPVNSLANFATARGEIDDLFLASALTRHPNGVFVLPAPCEIEEAESVGHDEVKIALDLLRARFRWTVVDTARTVTGATAAALEASKRILLVSDLSVPGIRSARRSVELLTRLAVPLEHVELLVTEAVPGPVSIEDAARVIGKQPFFVLPRDEASAAEAMNHGAPLNGKPTKLALAMTDLAAKVAGVTAAAKPTTVHRLRRLFARSEGVHA